MQKFHKYIFIIISVIIGITIFYSLASKNSGNQEIPFSRFLDLAERGQIDKIVIEENRIISHEDNLISYIPKDYSGLIPLLYKKGINFRVVSSNSNGLFFIFLNSWLPIILIIGVWLFFMKQMQGSSNVMKFGKSKSEVVEENAKRYTFKDVAGIDESKAELDEIVEFLKNPDKFEKLGGKIPTGVLLVGEPGTGKTLLAKAIAGEAQVSFFNISGSDFVEMFVGVGASRVRDLFRQAREKAPGIIFIDEIDAVGRHRGAGLGGGNDEREQTLNQLLVELDGFEANKGVIVLAATNRPDVLDYALTRPGRFDRQVTVPRPDINGRLEILKIHTKNLKLGDNVGLKTIAQATPGFTGADLANLANESALIAAHHDKAAIDMDDFEEARDKIMMGKERRSLVISEEEKRTTACHEAGHAIIAALMDEVDPVHKVTIIPRGRALGLTMLLPEFDKYSHNKSRLKALLMMMMGGRAAEDIVFNHFTTGASNDLEQAASLAHNMVCKWGMSDKIGPVYLAANENEVFLGRDMMRKKHISQLLANTIDMEVKRIVNSAYRKAIAMLKQNINTLHKVTDELIKRETINGDEILKIIKDEL